MKQTDRPAEDDPSLPAEEQPRSAAETLGGALSLLAARADDFLQTAIPNLAGIFEVLSRFGQKLAAEYAEYKITAEAFAEKAYRCHWFHCPMMRDHMAFEEQVVSCDDEQVDGLFFAYYDAHLDELAAAVEGDGNGARAALVKEAVEAYRNGKYSLVIPALFSVLEGLVYERTDSPPRHKQAQFLRRLERLTGERKKQLVFFSCSRFYDQIAGEVYADADLAQNLPFTGIPNRHVVVHGFRFDYATKKAALNTVLMIATLYCIPLPEADGAADLSA